MNNRPDLNDDFISSAGVPTIPLKPQKKRLYRDLIAYALFATAVVLGALIGYSTVLYSLVSLLIPYAILLVVSSILVVILGLVIKQNVVVLVGLLGLSLGVGVMFSQTTYGIVYLFLIVFALMGYYWYRGKSGHQSSYWPVSIAFLLMVSGTLIIAQWYGFVSDVLITPVLIAITGAMIVWEIRRTKI